MSSTNDRAKDRTKRQSIIEACREMNRLGINQGTSGNISLRHGDGMLITPTSTPYDTMQAEQIVFMKLDSAPDAGQRPSSEWRFHRDILKARGEVNAVVHAHPPYSTMLAIMGMEIPPVHYMIACAGGDSIRCAPYATFGTEELSRHAVTALEDRSACLLAHHGMIAVGSFTRKSDVARGRSRNAGAAISRLPADRDAAAPVESRDRKRSRTDGGIRHRRRRELRGRFAGFRNHLMRGEVLNSIACGSI